MTRVLLTGAGGFVGHHTLEHILATTDWDVVATDSFRHRGKTDRIVEVLEPHPEWKDRVKVVTHDLRVQWSSQLIYRVQPVEYVIAMASESHVDRSITEPLDFIENNVKLAMHTFDAAIRLNARAVVLVSTDEVYGPAPLGHAHEEWESIIPSNPYSASKAAQEAIAISWWRTYNMPLVITNTMNIIGERQDPEKFLPKIIRSVQTGDKLTIHASKTGTIGSRMYLHARNQADALLYLLKSIEINLDFIERAADYYHPPHVNRMRYTDGATRPLKFHIAGEQEIDNLELGQMVERAYQMYGDPKKKLNYELVDFHSSRPGHDLRYALDSSLIHSLGWKAPVPLEASIQKTVQWTLEHPEWMEV